MLFRKSKGGFLPKPPEKPLPPELLLTLLYAIRLHLADGSTYFRILDFGMN